MTKQRPSWTSWKRGKIGERQDKKSLLDNLLAKLGIRPVTVGELNARATGEAKTFTSNQTARATPQPLEDIEITDEYKAIFELIESRFPVIFVTDKAGTGKSTLVRWLRSLLSRNFVVIAPTGVAALNVGGVTIHMFFR
ncbi:MAG: hypothetical protein ABFD97_18920 [Syntrophobacter sp.]